MKYYLKKINEPQHMVSFQRSQILNFVLKRI